jgi:NADPH:quinone reductase-like Zn-dependent oxidoreductase
MSFELNRAHVVRIHEPGGPGALRYERIGLPAPVGRQVLVHQHAIGVNLLDTYHRRGLHRGGGAPMVLGVEAAGEVVAIGPEATRVSLGDRVSYVSPTLGSYASNRVIDERWLIRLPDAVSYEQAAAVTFAGLVVHMMLHQGEGQVLVPAAGGRLGQALADWVRREGAHVVGLVTSAEEEEAARGWCDAVRRLDTDALARMVFDLAEGVSAGAANDGPLPAPTAGLFAHLRALPDIQTAGDCVFGALGDRPIPLHKRQRFLLAEAARAHAAVDRRGATDAFLLFPEAWNG